MQIKNWKRFQHFKDRKPPWIKLYRDLLDDLAWHELPAEAAKTLVMLWLIASEGEEGRLPDKKTLSFRLRISEKKLTDTLSMLFGWVEQRDIKPISSQYQNDLSETETETETECDITHHDITPPNGFETFWETYPRKVGRGAAEKAWSKISFSIGVFEKIVAAVAAQSQQAAWLKDDGQFIPHPATWLNQKRWLDQVKIKQEVASWDQMPQPISKPN